MFFIYFFFTFRCVCKTFYFHLKRIKSAATKKIMWNHHKSHIQKTHFLNFFFSVNRLIVHPHTSFMRAFYCHSMLRLCRFFEVIQHYEKQRNCWVQKKNKFIYSVDFWVMRNWNSFLLISIIWLFSFFLES